MSKPRLINLNALAAGHRHARPANRAQSGEPRAWYRIQDGVDGASADITIYDEIGYWGTTAQGFVDELAALDAPQINVRLNTPGGDVYDGIAIYNALLRHPADVTTYVDGVAASIGSVIAQAGSVRVMAKASQMMIHDPWTMCVGNAQDMTDCADMLGLAADMLAQVYADRSDGDAKSWRAAMQRETWYSSDEAVSAGLADTVVNRAAVDSPSDLSNFRYAGRAKAPAPANLRHYNPDAVRRAIMEAAR